VEKGLQGNGQTLFATGRMQRLQSEGPDAACCGFNCFQHLAEGSERNSTVDFRRFIFIAKGSAAELRTQIYISSSIGIINQGDTQSLIAELVNISKMLQGLCVVPIKTGKKMVLIDNIQTNRLYFNFQLSTSNFFNL